MKQIRETWPEDVRIVLQNRPLEFHKRAEPAARAAMAAHQQGKFWEYHDLLFEKKKFEDPDLEGYATELGLDMAKFKADMASPTIKEQVAQQDAACVKVGATGTPAFFVNGRKLSGAKPFPDFKVLIEEELAKAKKLVEAGTPRAEIYEKVLKEGRKTKVSGLDGPVRRFDLSNSPSSGPAGAVATLVIFSDFECPFCSTIVEPVHEAEKKMPGQIRVVFKQFPLTSIHPNAKPAAIASLAAHRQGRFWEYHDILFKNQKRLGKTDLIGWAKVIGLDVAKFEADMADPALAAQVSAEMAEASRVGVRGTPSVFLNGRKMKSPPTNADVLVDLINTEVLKIED